MWSLGFIAFVLVMLLKVQWHDNVQRQKAITSTRP